LKKGQRKYVCRDCGAPRSVHWVELNRRALPRCLACGGLVDPASEGARDDREIGDLNRREHADDRGDLVRARN
jgi:DNA-directed RNA polymerase subunit RPC12/RpoP